MSGIPCVHCGADCGSQPELWNDKAFCCNGCKQVYRLLNENNLGKYYEFQSMPGLKITAEESGGKYAFLDQETIYRRYLQFNDGEIARTLLYLPCIHCASCIWLLEHLQRLHSGVLNSSVHFSRKELTITFRIRELSFRQLVELLDSIHYQPDLSPREDKTRAAIKNQRILLYKIGLAGFVFGNVMLYSLPEYFNGKPIGGAIGNLLYYLTYVLTIPMVFYSGSDYLSSAWKNLRKGMINIDLPIAIGLLALFFVTTYHIFTGSGPGYSDSLAGFLFFLLLGRWYQSKTYDALSFDRDYKSYFPLAVTRLSKEKEESILLEEIVEGDVLLVRNKELIPADSILEDGDAHIDYSFVTGESVPVHRKKGDTLYAGGIQQGSPIRIRVSRAVDQSHLTQLWNENTSAQSRKSNLSTLVDAISVRFTVAVILIALAGFSYWWWKADAGKGLLVLCSVLIVACPCALALSAPFTFGNAMRMLGKLGMYLKNTQVVENMARINTLVFDKTGTITIADRQEAQFFGNALSQEENKAVAQLARSSAHPLSYALYKALGEGGKELPREFVEMPGKGVYGVVSGLRLRLGSAEFTHGQHSDFQQGKLGVHVNINDVYRGFYSLKNQYRHDFHRVITELAPHFELHLLSGDHEGEKEHLLRYFSPEHLHFFQQPADKMHYIRTLQQQGKKVLMTGDGLNDAGAFMESDVALSVADNVHHFSPASDAIVEASAFPLLDQFFRFARQSLLVVKLSFLISLFYNLIGISFALSGHLSPVVAAILMPASSVSVVAFATFTTRWLARKITKVKATKAR